FRGLMGYYLRTSNRVALFDPGDGKNNVSSTPTVAPKFMEASIEGSLADTMIHEATHQVAF
ncbi:MAG: hypothetical protein KDA84_24830, partial [Planctomycetaceae bacterium]|nr:hypothetical protein [Planctomycetaceae bacterium]